MCALRSSAGGTRAPGAADRGQAHAQCRRVGALPARRRLGELRRRAPFRQQLPRALRGPRERRRGRSRRSQAR